MKFREAFSIVSIILLRAGGVLGTNEEGNAFLAENKGRDGVVTLKSGLQYKVLRKGTGKYSPKKETSCECHYAGTTLRLTPDAIDKDESEWKEFDSSYKRGEPTSFAPNQVIKGWTEAMQKMVEGDKWEMYIPSELGYGESGSGDKIKGGEMLIFRMELLKIKGKKKRVVHCDLKTQENCDPEEVEILNEYGDMSLDELQKKIKAIEEKTSGALKSGEREKYDLKLKVLQALKKNVKKRMKKGEL